MAGQSADHERHLNEIFGDESWKAIPTTTTPFNSLCRKVLALYKSRIRSLPSVHYVFSFEMSKSQTGLDYFLVFASQHPLGLEKMKEAMGRMDQTGEYRFSDAHVGRPMLFRFDRPEDFAPKLLQHFVGQEATYAEVRDYALNETPFPNPKSMLRLLERQNLVRMVSSDPKRRKGTFTEESTVLIVFEGEQSNG